MKTIEKAAVSILLAGVFGCAWLDGELFPAQRARAESRGSASEKEIESLFDAWNRSLQTGDPRKVAALYAEKSILLPTLSGKARLTREEKEDYFRRFLEKKPIAKIDFRQIQIGSDMAVDSGLYTFVFAKTGETARGRYSFVYRREGPRWLIVSHHSSLQPDEK